MTIRNIKVVLDQLRTVKFRYNQFFLLERYEIMDAMKLTELDEFYVGY